MMQANIPDIVAAVAALGTAAYALVDCSKAFWGGVSNAGFGFVERAVSRLYPADSASGNHPLNLPSILATLKANWLNGTALHDQKAIAKSLIKLRLDQDNAPLFAKATGVDAARLTSVAKKIAAGEALDKTEADVLGRFDLMLTAILDEGYQRADQMYRNHAKAWSVAVSVLLAVVGGWHLSGSASFLGYLGTQDALTAVLVGLLATPIAPISKDLSSALTAAVRAAQMFRK